MSLPPLPSGPVLVLLRFVKTDAPGDPPRWKASLGGELGREVLAHDVEIAGPSWTRLEGSRGSVATVGPVSWLLTGERRTLVVGAPGRTASTPVRSGS